MKSGEARQVMCTDDKAPWITLLESEPAEARCARCGSVDVYPSGIDLGDFAKRSKAFMRVHRKCKAKAA